MSTKGQGLTISVPGQRGGDITHLGITDSGSTTVHVTDHAELIGKANGCLTSRVDAIRITPHAFTLTPGGRVTTTVYIPPGTPTGNYAAVYYGSLSGKGNVHIAGSVGALLRWHGTTTLASCHRTAAVAPTSSGFPLLWVAVGLLALVLAVVGTAAWLRRRA
jgi:hypothetical protein